MVNQALLTVDTLIDENDGDLSVGDVSLREALAFVDVGGVIDFAPDLAGMIALNANLGELVVAKSLTLDGPGAEAVTVSGGDQVRVFRIAADVKINDLAIADGNADVGAGVYVEAGTTAVIRDSTLADNIASQDGGGLYNDEGFVDLTGSSFSDNTASQGGGLFNEAGDAGGTLTIDDSTFSGNRSNFGGAIFIEGGEVAIVNSSISGNFGATYYLSYRDSGRYGPGGPGGGGGIYNSGGELAITNSAIDGNTAEGTNSTGGGVVSFGGSLQITNSTLSSNVARGQGAYGGGLIAGGGTVTLSNSVISGNRAAGFVSYGGGISSSSELLIENSTITDNTADGIIARNGASGGGISTGGGSLTVNNSTVSRNSADGYVAEGGGIYARDTTVSVNRTTINDNSSGSGGGIANHNGELTVSDSTVDGNSSGGRFSHGGGILNSEGSLQINHSTVSNNSAFGMGGDGGGISSISGTVTLSHSVVSSNSAVNGGGVFSSNSPLSADDSTIEDNNASVTGGGISISGSPLNVNDSTISGNQLRGDGVTGGGIYANSDTAIVNRSTVSGNFAGGINAHGGGLAGGSFTVSNSTISSNIAYGSRSGLGGGIAATDLTVSNSTITENTASAIRYEGYSIFYDGGGVYLLSRNRQAIVASSIISGNKNSDVSGNFVSQGNNLIGVGMAARDFDQPTDIIGITNPGLEPLADNGGPTQTHALRADSPAIDAGANPNGLATDQRGNGFDRVINGQADIGAFEVQNLDLEIGLYDADTDALISVIQEGDQFLASSLMGQNLSIAAIVPDGSALEGQVESVFLDLNDGLATRTENFEPYALFADFNGDIQAGPIPFGDNTIALDLYSENGLQGDLLTTVTRNFAIVDDISGLAAIEVGLYDADTDQLIALIEEGTEILASEVMGRSLNIAAFISPDSVFANQVESVFVNLNDGQIKRTENVEPYALFGDVSGDFNQGTLAIGENAIAFDLYTEDGLMGNLIGSISGSFTIVDDMV